jgi:outer membrane protein assembly factor BamB
MSETLRLPLRNPVAMTGARRRIWIADEDSSSLAVFDPASGHLVLQIGLDDKPVAASAAAGFVVAGTASAVVTAYDPNTGQELWRRAASSGDLELKPSHDYVWVWDRQASSLISFDLSGNASRLDARGAIMFTPAPNGIYWLSANGTLGFRSQDQRDSLTTQLPPGVLSIGAMVVCANVLWLSIPDALLLFDLRSLELRATLKAPEGPVSHLICDNGRLFGGSRGVFLLDPAADANAHSLPITLQSPLRGLAVAGENLWALESTEPLVHILNIP